MELAVFMRLRAATLRGFADAQFLQHNLQRTKARQRGLQQVEPDESREPKPIRAVKMGQQQARKDECAGEQADVTFQWHKGSGVVGFV